MKTKICTECKTELPATGEYFHADKYLKSGLRSRCKECCIKYQKEYQCTAKGRVIHGQASHKYQQTIKGHLRQVYKDIKRRCSNLKCKDYKNYGGRGIKNLFKSSDEFVDYVVNKLRINLCNLQIDRIDNDGNYEPGNIRFVTCKENCNNRRERKN